MRTLLFSLLFIPLYIHGQNVRTIRLSMNKTVHVFFPERVIYNDVGTADILIEEKGVILKLAAALEGFEQTNLTVITVDSVIYSFLLEYSPVIDTLNVYVAHADGRAMRPKVMPKSVMVHTVIMDSVANPPASMDQFCSKAMNRRFAYWDEGAYYKKVYLALNNIFVAGDKLYFVVSAGNTSNIAYDIDYFKIGVKDKRRSRRSSIQEVEKYPVYEFEKPDRIDPRTHIVTFVLVFDKFTIPGGKKLVFEMGEKGGGRALSYSLQEDLIINALAL